MTNREIIEGALKRVNALAGTNGKLKKDSSGWFIYKNGSSLFDESTHTTEGILAYLHGIEDTFNYLKIMKQFNLL